LASSTVQRACAASRAKASTTRQSQQGTPVNGDQGRLSGKCGIERGEQIVEAAQPIHRQGADAQRQHTTLKPPSAVVPHNAPREHGNRHDHDSE
jgi:3-deoxy-D-arabino-heptulosonate 7-phosphate (DAHP) synthase